MCASDCGYRCEDVRLKPKTSTKHTNALIQAMILNISSPLTKIVLYSQTAPIYNNSFEVCAIVVDVYRIILGIFIIFELSNLKETGNGNKPKHTHAKENNRIREWEFLLILGNLTLFLSLCICIYTHTAY